MSNIVSFILQGGFLVFPLILCALIGLILIIERTFFWVRLTSKYNTKDVEHVYTLMAHKHFEDAKNIIEGSKDPSLICLKHCLASKGRIHSQILQSLAQQKLDHAKKSMAGLETVINISPLLGILGTVLGIITSVASLTSESGDIFNSQVMIAGLSQALVTTALGLVISIIGLIVYNQFKARIENLRSKLERDISAFESLVTP